MRFRGPAGPKRTASSLLATYHTFLHPHSRGFSRRFRCSPDRLGPRHIREYQAELFQKKKLSPGTVAVRLAALMFFYSKTRCGDGSKLGVLCKS
jgi:Phage integrase, N-terminal SAM-like domain